MNHYYYSKTKTIISKRNITRFVALFIFLCGVIASLYITLPLVSWQFYFAPAFAAQSVESPIPHTTIVNTNTIGSLIKGATNTIGVDYTNAKNWYPTVVEADVSQIPTYTLSIPKINVENATVSTTDYDLSKHLVHYAGTAFPPQKGTSVIFGHSTLPQLFNPTDYKTIFANAYKLQIGDEILITVNNITYTYKIFNTIVTHPDDTSIFTQTTDDSYVTLVTCTPPGTTWKRLILKAKLENI